MNLFLGGPAHGKLIDVPGVPPAAWFRYVVPDEPITAAQLLDSPLDYEIRDVEYLRCTVTNDVSVYIPNNYDGHSFGYIIRRLVEIAREAALKC